MRSLFELVILVVSSPMITCSGIRVVPGTSKIYGGTGDPPHLGGWIMNDTDTQSPRLWDWMINELNIHSVIDVGCGRGISTKYFLDSGLDARCVEGSKDAVKNAVIPQELIHVHDYAKGAFVPNKTVDAAWSIEFLEHVGRQYMPNYMETFKKAALIFVSHSLWGGYHHVEVHDQWWWKARMAAQGFIYSDELTQLAHKEAHDGRELIQLPGGGVKRGAQHLWTTLMVFINPAVASLAQHQHLIGGVKSCFRTPPDNHRTECTGDDKLPQNYLPVRRPDAKDNSALLQWKDERQETRTMSAAEREQSELSGHQVLLEVPERVDVKKRLDELEKMQQHIMQEIASLRAYLK
eukprot:gnl/TRDRNA2_/TRDRNA2_85194_c0_seq3.p1 gnl/TRDRNA2_/TRDRNA2_85194_c0~~gnl/TRDRNA2_/TRDRNA2_85194_c0_seq3.p1  ORF type:complete len:350 (+),score=50.63 gnl/TRDRNA2_/TRDRNA2_85194_c0_seq3:74-1123(+)